jgi:hypothetical protein
MLKAKKAQQQAYEKDLAAREYKRLAAEQGKYVPQDIAPPVKPELPKMQPPQKPEPKLYPKMPQEQLRALSTEQAYPFAPPSRFTGHAAEVAAYAVGGFPLATAVSVGKNIYSSLRNPAEAIKTLASIEGFVQSTSSRISRAVDKFIRLSSDAVSVGSKATRTTQTYLLSKRDDDKPKSMKLADIALQPHSGGLNAYKHNASVLADRAKADATLKKLVDKLHKLENGNLPVAAPKILESLQRKQEAILKALIDEYPKDPTVNPINANFSKYIPPRSEIRKWEVKYEVATKPMSVIKKLENGEMLDVESVATLKRFYPQLYNQMSTTLLEKLSKMKTELPRKAKTQVSIFLGLDIDQISPEFLAKVQQSYAASDKDQGPKPSGTAQKELNRLQDNYLTQSERLLK